MSTEPDSPATPELITQAERIALADPTGESDERWQLVNQLHTRNEPEIFEQAATWCASQDPLLRCLGADVLAELGWQEEHPFKHRSEPLLGALLKDAEPAVISSALHAHCHLELGTSEHLCRFASHSSPDVRHALAGCLGSREDPLARQTLIALSTDEDSDVRDWATFGLGSLTEVDSPEIRAALVARLEDEDVDTRCEAMVGLAERGDARAVPFVEKELARDAVGQLAVDAAGLLADARFLPSLESLLASNPDDDSIRAAIERCRAARRG